MFIQMGQSLTTGVHILLSSFVLSVTTVESDTPTLFCTYTTVITALVIKAGKNKAVLC